MYNGTDKIFINLVVGLAISEVFNFFLKAGYLAVLAHVQHSTLRVLPSAHLMGSTYLHLPLEFTITFIQAEN